MNNAMGLSWIDKSYVMSRLNPFRPHILLYKLRFTLDAVLRND